MVAWNIRNSRRRRLLVSALGLLALAAPTVVSPGEADAAPSSASDLEWVGAGEFRHVYDTSRESPSRYLNDHSIIQGPDGTWHMFGITGVEAPRGQAPDSSEEDSLAHATAPELTGPWTTQPPVLHTDPEYGEDHLWAPHVIEHDGTYYMFYSGGGGNENAAINLATSQDLRNWTRLPSGPLFRDGWVARDPFVLRVQDRWVMYYTATSQPTGGNHVVAYRTSEDLIHWGERHIAYRDPTGTWNSAPVTESPFVVHRGGWWYLFIGPRGGYVGTDVYRSRDPLHFEISNYAGHFPAHAPEIVRDGDQWYATHAGWFQDGLHLAPLHWRSTPPPWQSRLNPAVVRNEDGRLEAFAVDPEGETLLHREQRTPGGEWTSWEKFGDAAGAAPTVGRNKDGTLEVFALGDEGRELMHRKQTSPDGGWGPWKRFGGPAGAVPAVARNADGRLEVFAIGPGGAYLSHRRQLEPGGDWGPWERFGGPAGGPPTVARNADGRLEVFAMGPGGAYLSHRWQLEPGGRWSEWQRFGGPAGSTPVVARNADGRLEAFVLKPYGGGIAHRWQTAPSGGWSDWHDFGTWAGAAPTVARNADGRLEVFAIGPGNDYVAHRWQTQPSGGWSRWEIFGGPTQCTPSPVRQADGRLTIYALSPGGDGVYQRTQSAPSGDWLPWRRWAGPVGGSACGSAS